MESLLVVFFALVAVGQPRSIQEYRNLIEVLGQGIEAVTIVIYGCGEASEYADQAISTPKLIITKEVNFELRNQFNSRILSVVFLESSLTENCKSAMNTSLHRRHYTDVLFITATPITSALSWEWLFEWCWDLGFYNMLLADLSGVLLTFTPFPEISTRSTTLTEYLEQRNNWRDFQGYAIRVGVGNNPPRSLVYLDKKGEYVYSGVYTRFLKIFCQHYNATFTPVHMPDFANYNLLDCIRYLRIGKVDTCADGYFMEPDRVVSRTLYMSYGYIIVRFAQPVEKYRYFLVPFQGPVWVSIGCCICYIALATALIHWHQEGVWNAGQFFLEALSSIIYISFTLKLLRGKYRYIIYIGLILCGFIVSNLYLATLSSIFSTNVYEGQINSPEQLREQNIPVLINELNKFSFEKFGVSPIVTELLVTVSEDVLNQHRSFLDPRYAYYNIEDKNEYYLYQQKFLLRPRATFISKPVAEIIGGYPLPFNSPFEQMLNNLASSLFEGGFFYHILRGIKEEAIRCGELKFLQTEYYEVVPLSMEYFRMPAILLATGYATACICIVLEVLRQRVSNLNGMCI